LNLPEVSADDFDEEAPSADVSNLPVLYPVDEADEDEVDVSDDDVADALAVIEKGIPDIESALSAENDPSAAAVDQDPDDSFEPIEATEWPDPRGSNTVIKSMHSDSDDATDDEPADVDASARNG
jgi:hypothetical protein